MSDALRVVAHLGSQIAGEPPHLDSLLVSVLSRLSGKKVDPGLKVDRRFPCPDSSSIAIPVRRRWLAGVNLAVCSSPISSEPTNVGVEYFAKRIGVEHANLLSEDSRKIVPTTNGWTKSYRLPVTTRRVDRVVWMCVGNRREILKVVKHVPAIGKKTSYGYGQVLKFEVERLGEAPKDWPFWIDSEAGPVLMRPIPLAGVFDGLIGWRRGFGACADPYWHPERFMEIAVPC